MKENWATTGTITKIPARVLATLPNPTPPIHNTPTHQPMWYHVMHLSMFPREGKRQNTHGDLDKKPKHTEV